jgi:YHS domain-containing protein
MMRFTIAVTVAACCLIIGILAGCVATPDERGAAASTQPHAECLVCKKNADLACIDVPVDGKTPTYAYGGKTYYFCSDECRNNFAKHPSRYLPK